MITFFLYLRWGSEVDYNGNGTLTSKNCMTNKTALSTGGFRYYVTFKNITHKER